MSWTIPVWGTLRRPPFNGDGRARKDPGRHLVARDQLAPEVLQIDKARHRCTGRMAGPDHGSTRQDLVGQFGCSNCQAAGRDRRPGLRRTAAGTEARMEPTFEKRQVRVLRNDAGRLLAVGGWPRGTDLNCYVRRTHSALGEGVVGNIAPVPRTRRRKSLGTFASSLSPIAVLAMLGVTSVATLIREIERHDEARES